MIKNLRINVTSFSSISFSSNVRLIWKIELEQNFQSTILDIHASANKRPQHLFRFKLRSTNKYGLTLDSTTFFGDQTDLENQVQDAV